MNMKLAPKIVLIKPLLKTKFMKYFIVLLIFSFLSLMSVAQRKITDVKQPGAPGTLDDSFGSNGKAVTNFKNAAAQCYTSALQRDGKILAAGQYGASTGRPSGFFIIRYLADGSVDSSFSDDGYVVTSLSDNWFTQTLETIRSIAVQPDNKIVVAGYASRGELNDEDGVHPNFNLALVRYMPNGSLDSTFGENGKVMTDFGVFELGYAVTLQPDGKIVVGGSSQAPFDIDNFLVTRYLPNGNLDSSFGEGGKVITDFNDSDRDIIRALALQSDGKIVAGGTNLFVGDSHSGNFALARYERNGLLDASFGNGGMVLTDFGPNGDEINDIALQPDGKIVAAGTANYGFMQNTSMALVRYNTDGSLDPTFGEAGKTSIRFEEGPSTATSIALQEEGKIITAGRVYPTDFSGDFGIARCMPGGSLDSTFGTNGKTATDMSTENYDIAYDCALQEDGKIVLMGETHSSTFESYDIALARYHGDPVENPVIAQLKTWLRNNTLGWYTSNNSSVKYYSIQRSSNGSSFTEEKRVQANNTPRLLQQANTREQQTFTYALNTAATNSYYRVAAILNDGSTAFSPVVYYGSGKHITLYPNPVKDVLTVKGLQPEVNNLLTISDVGGNVLLSTTVHSSATYNYNVSRLKAGQYVLRVQSKEQVQSVRFVKE